ncbi:MAG: molybdopterin-dependent oxidoreductase [Eggerthellales bacterium]|nr:molybdopterin-dependent oxidoreductase [Eggerthellales bacterium]
MFYEEFLETLDRKAYHEGEWRWQEGEYTVTRTNHWSPPGCHNGCGVLLYVKDNKLEFVEGDPLAPFNNGKLCMRCLDLVEAVNHPDRLKYPLRRAGERGENKWERISWDEAYDEIVEKVNFIKENYGSHTILFDHGTGRNIGWQLPLFASTALETPNVSNYGFTGFACYLPRMIGSSAKMGEMNIIDVSEIHEKRYADPSFRRPDVVMVWGNEPLKSNADGFLGHWIVACMQLGTKIISIDPRLTWLGSRAEVWLQVRPGTDGALGIAMLNTIIDEDLVNHDFIDKWTYGYDALVESVQGKDADWAAEICGVDADDIRKAARLYATAESAAIQWGLAFEQQIAALGVTAAACDLMGVTGNIDNPGGNVLVKCAFDIEKRYGLGDFKIPRENYSHKLTTSAGIEESDIVACASADSFIHASEAGEPFKIQMLWIESGNPLACSSMDAPRAYEAMRNIPYIVVADPFMTPTAVACADIVLPVAMSCERNAVRTWWTPARSISKCCSYYEAKSDEDIVLELGRRLKPENWPWKDDKELSTWYLTDQYAKGGTSYEGDFEELQARGGYKYWDWDSQYYKYEKGIARPDGQPGFDTATGRFEFWSWGYNHWGVDPMPYHIEPKDGPIANPEMYKDYPLIATSGGRSYEFFHSEHRQLETMREFHPYPLVTMHPDLAAEHGIKDGDWVWIESPHGRCRQKAFLFPGIKKDTIHMEHAWWYPEEEAAEPSLYGVFDSNINNMTKIFETGQGGIGSGIKSFLAKIYKYEEGDEMPGVTVTEKGGFGDYVFGAWAGDKKTAEERMAKTYEDDAVRRAVAAKVADADMQGRNALNQAMAEGEDAIGTFTSKE